jgi:PHD/YefM family antitoxin component YafN of YafNO toxin-antitoxin module
MKSVSASNAKQLFGALLADAAREPVRIERHGKTVAAMVPPGWLARQADLDPRRAARAAQQERERAREEKHLRLAVKLLTLPAAQRKAMIAEARAMVDRWQAEQLCSADYIARWRAWLSLPTDELAKAMTSSDDEWAAPMRQNSPFVLPA